MAYLLQELIDRHGWGISVKWEEELHEPIIYTDIHPGTEENAGRIMGWGIRSDGSRKLNGLNRHDRMWHLAALPEPFRELDSLLDVLATSTTM